MGGYGDLQKGFIAGVRQPAGQRHRRDRHPAGPCSRQQRFDIPGTERERGAFKHSTVFGDDPGVVARLECAPCSQTHNDAGRTEWRDQTRHQDVRVYDDPHSCRRRRTSAISALISFKVSRSATGLACTAMHRLDGPQCLGLPQRRQRLVEGFRRCRGQQCDGLAVRGHHQVPLRVERLPDCRRSTPKLADTDEVHRFFQFAFVYTIVYANEIHRQHRRNISLHASASVNRSVGRSSRVPAGSYRMRTRSPQRSRRAFSTQGCAGTAALSPGTTAYAASPRRHLRRGPRPPPR